MRFLLFNIVVAFGLIYLFSGDHKDIQSFADTVAKDAAQVTKKLTHKVKEIRQPLETTKIVEVKPKAKPSPKPVVKTPPPLAPEIAVAKREAKKVNYAATRLTTAEPLPEVAERRAEIMEEIAKPKTTSDRRQALLNLAENMELFHIESLGR